MAPLAESEQGALLIKLMITRKRNEIGDCILYFVFYRLNTEKLGIKIKL